MEGVALLFAVISVVTLIITLSPPNPMSFVVVPLAVLPWFLVINISLYGLLAAPFICLIAFGLSFVRPGVKAKRIAAEQARREKRSALPSSSVAELNRELRLGNISVREFQRRLKDLS